MASAKSLEDMLSSDVDESAVSALVGSLESQLLSSNIHIPSQDVQTSLNHINCDSLRDGQKLGPTSTHLTQASSILNKTNSQVVTNNATSPSTPNTVMVTLAGALPASGYISQVTSPAQQALLNTSAGRNSDIKIVYSPQPTTNTSSTVIQAQRGKVTTVPNGNVGRPATTVGPVITMAGASVVTTAGMTAIQNLANIASQQAPLMIPNACTTPPSTIPISVNAKQVVTRLTVREQLEQKQQTEKLNVKTQPQLMIKEESPGVHQPHDSTNVIIPLTQAPPPVVTNVIQVSSATPTVVTVAKTTQSQSQTQPGQPVNVVTQVVSNPNILPGVQIVNVSPRTQGIAGQKTLAPRLVFGNPVRIAPQMLTARPGAPVQTAGQNTITLQHGMVRGTILVKTENGQLQVVNVAPGLAPSSTASSIPATYRLQSVQLPGSAVTNSNVTQPLTIQTTTANVQAANASSQMSPNTAKKKCKNFLSTLIQLASDQPEQVATNVKNLIQGLIDGDIQPEEFTNQLQKALNSSPQPCLVPFLKKNLPYLRYSLMMREMTIEGVRPPPPGSVSLPPAATAVPQLQVVKKIIAHSRPAVQQATAQVRVMAPMAGTSFAQFAQSGTPQNIITQQRIVTPRLPASVVSHAKSLLVTTATKAGVSLSSTAISPATVGVLQTKGITASRTVSSLGVQKEKEKRSYSSLRDDDDINDVAAMGGVNLVEESQRILASNAEIVGTQIRSCKDENFVFTGALQRRINMIAAKYGLGDTPSDVLSLISHATQERLKTLVEKLGIIAEHRVENIKNDPRYEVTQDVKAQLKFLEELDRIEKKKHEEQEREMLLRAAKSRSKLEDPEQLKLKQKAKEMQRAEMEEMRQREANMTALLAIGPRKKLKPDPLGIGLNQQLGQSSPSGINNTIVKPQMRPRVKRVNLRDLLFLMDQEKETVRTPLLYKAYLK
ncbi:transcription initiation factor TFIID subunit 4-like [Centruroides vittatus]|uniref:transcription initiation factor TFIID subunit 4-like n=1 Tax=Centruroides vittatus TaxID=120091 RepID=UPI00350F5C75